MPSYSNCAAIVTVFSPQTTDGPIMVGWSCPEAHLVALLAIQFGGDIGLIFITESIRCAWQLICESGLDNVKRFPY